MQILFRGVVVVSSSVDKKLEIDVSLNGVKGFKILINIQIKDKV